MSRKEKLIGVFEFLMDLLDEKAPNNDIKTKETTSTNDYKGLKNPTLPYHPVLNPYVGGINPESVNRSLEMMNKIEAIDKERASERAKTKIVDNATRPLIKELEEIKAKGIENAISAKKDEELETIVGEFGSKLGVTVENGEIKIISVPTELRDNIPLDEIEKSEIVVGSDDLPQHLSDKLEVDISGSTVEVEPTVSIKSRTKKLVRDKPIVNNKNKK